MTFQVVVDKVMKNDTAIVEKKYYETFKLYRNTVFVKNFVDCSQRDNWNAEFFTNSKLNQRET